MVAQYKSSEPSGLEVEIRMHVMRKINNSEREMNRTLRSWRLRSFSDWV